MTLKDLNVQKKIDFGISVQDLNACTLEVT